MSNREWEEEEEKKPRCQTNIDLDYTRHLCCRILRIWTLNNRKRCRTKSVHERWKEQKQRLRSKSKPIGRNLLNEINRAEEWLPAVEEQEVPNEMGNTVYLPLFSVIRSFIAVRSFFSAFSWVPCETFVVCLFLIAVVFCLQRCDQDSYITGHSDTMHVHTHTHTSGHMWIFSNEPFNFLFHLFLLLLLSTEWTWKKIAIFLC